MNEQITQVIRFGINGLIATAVHYLALLVNLELLSIQSAGLANSLAAVVGITCSFFGSRYFVFRARDGELTVHATRFLSLYIGVALFHGVALYLWSDVYKADYRIGFVLATLLQVTVSYAGNRIWVFK